MTAAELGRRAGVTENAIRKIESGDSREPRFSTGVRIASALGVDPAAILGQARRTEKHATVPELARVLAGIRECRGALAAEGVEHVSVFGSVARGEARAGSDVDVVVDPIPSAPFTILNIVGVMEILRRRLGQRVDVLDRETIRLRPFASAVEAEEVRAI